MAFPDTRFSSAGAYASAYIEELRRALASLDRGAMDRAAELLSQTYAAGRTVFCCGNGGSSAIANHLVCDHMKGVRTDTALRPKVVSLAAVMEVITAIANDMSYEEVFSYQIESLAAPGDVLITISSSGESENIVRALAWAGSNGLSTIALTGFSGGRSRELADIALHVEASNYGIVEDVHQSIMHMLAQYIRQTKMTDEDIKSRKF